MAGYTYKTGDRVMVRRNAEKVIQNNRGWTWQDYERACFGKEFTITSVGADNYVYFIGSNGGSVYFPPECVKLIKPTMDIKEKFSLALTKEPMKSFRKAGITNGDNLLTEDGMNIFLSWLLDTKFAEDFKKGVVDAMLEEADKK